MKRRSAGLASSVMFSGCIVLTCSSCSTMRSPDAAPAPRAAAVAPLQARLVQLAFGREAAFGVCVEPACPKVTPKTIAGAAAPVPVSLRPTTQLSTPPHLESPGNASAPTLQAPPQAAQPSARPPASEPMTRNIVVNFRFASAELTSDTKSAIRASLDHARQAERIVIAGRTDSVGDLKVNEALALARALAVRDYFRDLAPDLPATIAINAKGRCCFVATNTDELGRAKNRRVEIVFSTPGGA